MSNIDFQNGLAMGIAMKGKAQSADGAELNIVYGDTEPDDTSKLWIKANEPESIAIAKDFDGFEGIEKLDTLETTLPASASAMGCAKVGSKVYLFGGGSSLNTINIFDTTTETITTLETTLPISYYGMGCASVGTKIYLFGGYKGSGYPINTIYKFDTETETITTLSTTVNSGYAKGCTTIGTKIYLFGGYYAANSKWRYDSQIQIFDTETETITTLGVLPTACYGMGCASVGTKIYLFGGYSASGSLNTINVFDTETNTIITLETTLPISYYGMGCMDYSTKIYLFGGSGSNRTINMFDTETNTIITLDNVTIPTASSSNMGCASAGIKIYLFGGNGSGTQINALTVIHELTQNNIEVITGSQNFFNVVNTDTMKVEIGVDSVLIGNENNQAENCEAYLHNGTEWQQI